MSDSGLYVLKSLPDITSLDLNGTQRSDSGLWSVSLTDRGLETIAGLKHLERLRAAGTKISDAGVASIASACRLTGIGPEPYRRFSARPREAYWFDETGEAESVGRAAHKRTTP